MLWDSKFFTLLEYTQALLPLSKQVLIRWTREKIHFVAPSSNHIESGLQVYSHLQAVNYSKRPLKEEDP